MFSDHLRKIDQTTSRNLLFIAGGLAISCLLVAIGTVAGGQVRKAELRESQLSSQRSAMAQCFESSSRMERQSCVLQARNDRQMAANTSQVIDNYTDFSRAPSPSAVSGVMGVGFSSN